MDLIRQDDISKRTMSHEAIPGEEELVIFWDQKTTDRIKGKQRQNREQS